METSFQFLNTETFMSVCLFTSTGAALAFQISLLNWGWEDNIKMDLQEVGCGGLDWIKLSQDRDRWRALANAVMNLRLL